jgi:cell fate (sporulation/competence/biofilm development) regulator YlbF (YheA/YmcA/DUF963 family)
MKKKLNSMTIEISYKVAETSDSVNDAIGREIHEIETLTTTIKAQRDKLCAFIKENREAIDVDAVAATLKANGYAKQRISELLLSYGIQRKPQKKSAASKELQAKAVAELETLKKKYRNTAELKAILIRMYRAL